MFNFDHCFYSMDPEDERYSSQEDVFNHVGKDLLDNAFQGYNACIFAYGQTGLLHFVMNDAIAPEEREMECPPWAWVPHDASWEGSCSRREFVIHNYRRDILTEEFHSVTVATDSREGRRRLDAAVTRTEFTRRASRHGELEWKSDLVAFFAFHFSR